MAGQPAHRGVEGGDRKRPEPARHGPFDRQCLRARTTGRHALYGIEVTSPWLPPDGDPTTFGTDRDPLMGKSVGGIVVFGGGLALYDDNGVVGGLGVSGDSPCADHNVAWRVRIALGLDKVPAGVNPKAKDAIVYDLDPNGKSASGWGWSAP